MEPKDQSRVAALELAIGARMRTRRRQLGLSQSDLADKLGVSLSSVTSACYRHGVFFDRYSRARSPTLEPLPATQETGP